MDTVRYVMGVLFVVSVPPAVVYWLFIHPLVRVWRRVGPKTTYLVVGGLSCLFVVLLFRYRAELLGTDLGTQWILVGLGVLLYLASAWLSLRIRRYLDIRTFTGLPEISAEGGGGVLLQQGIYGVVRHPRYVAVTVGTAGFAIVVNYLGVYLVFLASILVLALVALLEERELADRFGAEYEDYRARVPAFVPRIRNRRRG